MADMTGRSETVRFAPLLVLLVSLIVVCYLPVTRYFFALDDLKLLSWATQDPGEMLRGFLGSAREQFRPLTKLGYFALMYPLFGLEASAYHAVSLLIHVINTLLVFHVLRLLELPRAAAYLSATLFGLSCAFFDTIAWISCIQQLLCMTFVVLTLRYAASALGTDDRRPVALSAAAYLLAVCSMEQAVLLPLVLALLPARNAALFVAARRFLPHVVILMLYLGFRFLWKSVPGDGPYRAAFGENVVVNAWAYLSSLYEYWTSTTHGIDRHWGVSPSHAVLAALVLYHAVRRHARVALFGAGFIAVTLVPALPLVEKTYYYHTYVPAFGAVYLLGAFLADAGNWRGARRIANQRTAALIAVTLLVAALSFLQIRRNERREFGNMAWVKANYLLDAAQMCGNFYATIGPKTGDLAGIDTIVLVYWSPRGEPDVGWVNDRLKRAVGTQRGARMLLGDNTIDVRFNGRIPAGAGERVRVLYCDERGRVHTPDEVPSR